MTFTARVLWTAVCLWAAVMAIEAIERPTAEEFRQPFAAINKALQ